MLRSIFFALAPLCSAASSPLSETTQIAETRPLHATLSTILTKSLRNSKLTPGTSLCVLIPNRAPIRIAKGWAERGTRRRALTRTDNFRLASISKTFSASLALRILEKQGAALDTLLDMSLENSLGHLINLERIPNGAALTMRRLLGMQTGLRDYLGLNSFDAAFSRNPQRRWSAEQIAHLLYGTRAKFLPGTDYDYSNSNYVLAQLTLEALTSKQYAHLMREEILDPTRFSSSFVEFERPRLTLSTHGYEQAEGGKILRDVTRENDGLGLADGGLISTPCDVARFVQKLLGAKSILSSTALAAMLSFGAETDYGLGIERESTRFGEARTHNGTSSGFQGQYYYFPERGLTWVLLTNSLDTDVIEPTFDRSMRAILKALR